MKNVIIFSVVCASIFMFSYSDYGSCEGTEGQKALACGACHGGSISGDVFILDGKTDEINSANFEFNLVIPTVGSPAIQLATASADHYENGPKIDVEIATEIKEMNNGSVYSLVNLFGKTDKESEGEMLNTAIRVQFDEELTEPHTIVVQGVLSNQDGTVNGDQSFYKEIVIEPQARDAFYFDHSIFLKYEEPSVMRVLDLQGRLVLSTPIDETMNKVDLSSLENGAYYAVFGSSSRDMKSLSFLVE